MTNLEMANDLRQKVLRGETVTREEMKQAIDLLREERISAKDSGKRKGTGKKKEPAADIESLLEGI